MPIISSNGQILIPKFVRDVLSISFGDEVDFQISGNQVFLCKKKHKKIFSQVFWISLKSSGKKLR